MKGNVFINGVRVYYQSISERDSSLLSNIDSRQNRSLMNESLTLSLLPFNGKIIFSCLLIFSQNIDSILANTFNNFFIAQL